MIFKIDRQPIANSIVVFAILFFAHLSQAQVNGSNFFEMADKLLRENVNNGRVDYESIKSSTDLTSLINFIVSPESNLIAEDDKKAFYINAYNLIVIDEARKMFPTSSVQDKAGFFDKMKITVGGEGYTLNSFEKKELLDRYQDPRLHFVLVCGALGCPPIINSAYTPGNLENQLVVQTKMALNSNFIKVSDSELGLSQIFKWYALDFGGTNKSIVSYINQYRDDKIEDGLKISHYPYDWSLNDLPRLKPADENAKKNNSARYVVSSTIPRGTTEVKLFNNLYSQRSRSNEVLEDRVTFFTTLTSVLYGYNDRFNIGFAGRYRRVLNNKLPSSPFGVLGSGQDGAFRQGITALGPQIRWAPVPKWSNFSIQSNFVFPIGRDLRGSDTQPYIDWGSVSWTTQFFNDLSIGNYFSLFTEVDIIWEDIGRLSKGAINQFSIPGVVILSYFPTPKATIYALGGVSPYARIPFDYFVQGGVGTKYQFTPDFEIELLYTGFTNTFLLQNGGDAQTFNLGIRFNL